MKDCAVARMHPTHSFNALLSLLEHTVEKNYSWAHSGDKLLCTETHSAVEEKCYSSSPLGSSAV